MDKSPYRSEEEELAGRQKDPVLHARNTLIERQRASEAELDALDAEIAAEMDAAIDFAVESDAPPLSAMFRDVYAASEPEPEPVAVRIARVLSREAA